VIGETAPLLVTTGVIDSMNANPFDGRMHNLAVYAYSEYRSPGVFREAAYALFEIFFGPGIRLGVMGSVALSVLMIPIVIRSAEEVLKIVPNHLREAAFALGTPKWKVIAKIVLPTAFAGLVTGVMLATARIVGETAPLLITTGVIDSINTDPFNGRMQNLAVYAYNEYRSPGVMKQDSYDRAWAAALTLIAIVMILNVVARFIYRRYRTEIR
jgi:phosphate transport system permease protein